MQADFNIVSGGETAQPLQKLLQEIEILMTSDGQTVITNYNAGNNLEKFLWKQGLSATFVASSIEQMLADNCYVPTGFGISVNVEFLDSKQSKDLMFIDIQVSVNGKFARQLIYTVQ